MTARSASRGCAAGCRCAPRRAPPRAARSWPAAAACPTDVRQFWLWRLNPSTGSTRSRSALSARPSGVCSRSASRLMSMPCALRRWKRSAPSGFSIGTMCDRQAIDDAGGDRRVALAPEPFEEVEERRRRGRLVAVHLRPEQDAQRTRARSRDAGDRGPRPTGQSRRATAGPDRRPPHGPPPRRHRHGSRAARSASAGDARPTRRRGSPRPRAPQRPPARPAALLPESPYTAPARHHGRERPRQERSPARRQLVFLPYFRRTTVGPRPSPRGTRTNTSS